MKFKGISILALLILLTACTENKEKSAANFETVFETSKGEETATYEETIDFYLRLAREYAEINVQTLGETDSGYPLHLVTFNPDGEFNFSKLREDKSILLVNNGIHPGESDGIDASMMLFRDLATNKIDAPKNTILVTIPVYNVGGMRNRNTTSRANQNGPKAYGFRGNAKNYDLNRDFIKMDTKNTATFSTIFHLVKPDVFIDNHVSNGADYQYTLTHLFTQHNKLGGELGEYLNDQLVPKLEADLSKNDWDITPYVNVFNRPPETGFTQFMDHPRYSTGYTTLWNTLGMMVETHMLKPYKLRVEGTYQLMKSMLQVVDAEHENIVNLRKEYAEKLLSASSYHLNWQVDTTKTTTLQFKGFEADTLISEITDMPRLKYNAEKPFTKPVAYSNHYQPTDTIEVPAAYIVKKAWQNVVERFEPNGITYYELPKDTTLLVESYRIEKYQTRGRAYEGHYLHYGTEVATSKVSITFEAGDLVVPVQQEGMRYLLETLEPTAPDSFFNWNFFDTILQQKEGFSPYVFEDVALELLKDNAALRDSFLLRKERDAAFAQNWYAQLDFIFKNSKYYEKAHMHYPVYRILKQDATAAILGEFPHR